MGRGTKNSVTFAPLIKPVQCYETFCGLSCCAINLRRNAGWKKSSRTIMASAMLRPLPSPTAHFFRTTVAPLADRAAPNNAARLLQIAAVAVPACTEGVFSVLRAKTRGGSIHRRGSAGLIATSSSVAERPIRVCTVGRRLWTTQERRSRRRQRWPKRRRPYWRRRPHWLCKNSGRRRKRRKAWAWHRRMQRRGSRWHRANAKAERPATLVEVECMDGRRDGVMEHL